jgi:chromosome segregation ATPase
MTAVPTVKDRLPMAKNKALKKRKKTVPSGLFISKLDKMRSQIQSLETQRLVENKRIERLKNAAAQMEKLAAEKRSALEQYRTTVVRLESERKAFENENLRQRTSSITALNNKTDNIEKLRAQYGEYRDAREREYEAARTREDKARQEYEEAKRLHDEAQKAYQAVRIYQEEIEKSFLQMRSLKAQIEKERNHKNKYFFTEDLKLLLSKTQLKSNKTLAAELTNAFNYLNSVREVFADKEASFDKAKADAEILEGELEMIDRTRQEKILAKL